LRGAQRGGDPDPEKLGLHEIASLRSQ